jgi:DNA uptake protein ComE-like DNA-binding protein
VRSRRRLAAAVLGACLASFPAAAPAADRPPLHVNDATREQLSSVPGIDAALAEKIVYLREQLGGLKSLRQLLSIPGVSEEKLRDLSAHLTLEGDEVLEGEAEAAVPDEAAEAPWADTETEESSSAEGDALSGEENALDELRENPLDLNKATDKQLLELPGVDRRMARRIVRERARMKKFASVSDLSRVSGVDAALLEKIRPFVKVQGTGRSETFFAGDTRFRLRTINPRGSTVLGAEPAFANNAYYFNRTRLRFGERVQTGWLSKRASVGPTLTPENLQRLTALKYSVQATDVGPFDKVIAGNYALSHGQGLVFYDGLGEFVRPAKVKAKGAKQDFSSGSNAYLNGVVADFRVGPVDAQVFVSESDLDLKLSTATGRVDADLNSLREGLGDLQDEADLANNDSTVERLYGGRLSWQMMENASVGFTAYESHYDHVVDPVATTFQSAHVFRGDKNVIGALDFDYYYRSLNLYGEAARSRSSGGGLDEKRGTGWTVTPLFRLRPVSAWVSFFDYDADFFTRHGKGVAYGIFAAPENLSDNQRGIVLGMEHDGSVVKSRFNYYIATFDEPLGSGTSSAPMQASQGRNIYWDNLYALNRSVQLGFRYRSDRTESNVSVPGGGGRRQVEELSDLFRYEVTWRPSREVRYRVRYEDRYSDDPLALTRDAGYLLMADVQFKPTRDLTLNARAYYFEAPDAPITTGVEEIWNGVIYPRLGGALQTLRGRGQRYYFTAKQAIGRDFDLWFKFDMNTVPRQLTSAESTRSNQESAAFGASRYGFHSQLDYRWGARTKKREDGALPTWGID